MKDEPIDEFIRRCKARAVPPGALNLNKVDDESQPVHYLEPEKVEEVDDWRKKFRLSD